MPIFPVHPYLQNFKLASLHDTTIPRTASSCSCPLCPLLHQRRAEQNNASRESPRADFYYICTTYAHVMVISPSVSLVCIACSSDWWGRAAAAAAATAAAALAAAALGLAERGLATPVFGSGLAGRGRLLPPTPADVGAPP